VKLISMWSGPRNVSTALMYSFRQRPDTRVVDEPYYAHYLLRTAKEHPGRDEIIANMATDSKVITENLLNSDREILFIKNMAHHLPGLEPNPLDLFTNILLTRDPKEMLPSLAKTLKNPGLEDTGLKEQLEILNFILKSGNTPIVLDAKETLLNPKKVLNELCNRLEIDFYEEMLSWPIGPKPEDGIWAKYWYQNVHKSNAFSKYREKTEIFPEELGQLYDESKFYYQELYKYAIKA